MSAKLSIPSYRNRYLTIQSMLQKYTPSPWHKVLNLGCGEGEYDPMIAQYARELIACDINPNDLAVAAERNRAVNNLTYQTEDALALTFANDTFDLLIAVEVIEHVGKPHRMLREVHRVLKPGGLVFLTFPSANFPFTYDPLNWILQFWDGKIPTQGAYAFGHDYLIDPEKFRTAVKKVGLEVVEEQNLSHYLIGLLEMYWTGWAQRLFKANAANQRKSSQKKLTIRSTQKHPFALGLTDLIIQVDKALFGKSSCSLGMAVVLQKAEKKF